MMARLLRTSGWMFWIAGAAVALLLLAGDAARVGAIEQLQTAQTLLNNATTGNVVVTLQSPRMCRESAVYIVWGAGTGAGAITVETAYQTNYTGTWAPLAIVAWTAANKTDVVQITGVNSALRTRVSTTVTGGTVSTYYVCN